MVVLFDADGDRGDPVLTDASAGFSTEAGREVRLTWLDTGAFEPQLLAIPAGPQGEPAGEWRVASEGDLATLKALRDQRGIFMLCDVPFGSRVRLDVAMADGVSVSRRPLVRPGIAVAVVVVTIAEGAPRRAPRLPQRLLATP
jgi:hypothetical protein